MREIVLSVVKPKWIKMAEQKPLPNQECWIYDSNRKFVMFDIWVEEDWTIDFTWKKYWFHKEDVTHWMPYFTPEPPNQ